MGTTTEMILVRHGETEWNVSGRWQGHADAPLNSRGVAQAQCLGEHLEGETFSACYVSDLGRAVRTAEIVGAPSGLDFSLDARLRERDLGVLQGLTTDEMQERCPEVYQSFRNDGPDYVLPEGESFRQFHERCVKAFEDFVSLHSGGRILVVTHGGVLGAVFRYVTGIPLDSPRKYVLLNCSVNVVEKNDKGWILRHWGDVGHLRELDSLDDD